MGFDEDPLAWVHESLSMIAAVGNGLVKTKCTKRRKARLEKIS